MHYRCSSRIWFGLVISLLLIAGCRQDDVASHWQDHPISIDGDQTDWPGRTLYVPTGKPVTVGVINDDSWLYVTLSTTDKELMLKALRLGFIVWLDPEGRTRETLGIKYPLGIFSLDQRSARSGSRRSPTPNIQQIIHSLPESQSWIEILGPRNHDVYQVPATDMTLAQVRLNYSEFGQLVYELKLPLKGFPNHPSSYSIAPGDELGIGFTTRSMSFSSVRGSGPGVGIPGSRTGGMPGGMPGGRSGGMPGGGMRSGGPRPTMSEPFTYWMQVTLAAKD